MICTLWSRRSALTSGSPEKRQEKAKTGSEAGTVSTPTTGDAHAEEGGAASGAEGEGGPGAAKHDGTRDAHPPAQKYRLTESMKSIIWQLVMLSNECCRLENEKKYVGCPGLAASSTPDRVHSELEGNNAQVSEQGTRKILYQKVIGACLVFGGKLIDATIDCCCLSSRLAQFRSDIERRYARIDLCSVQTNSSCSECDEKETRERSRGTRRVTHRPVETLFTTAP